MSTSSPAEGVRLEVWPTRSGSFVFPVFEGVSPGARVDAVMSGVAPGSHVLVGNAQIRDGLVAAGATQVRHLHTMRHDLRDVPTASRVDGLSLRPWERGDADLLAPALVAAYGPNHPDPTDQDLGAAAESLRRTVEDPDNPLIEAATQVARLGDRTVGAALVLRSEHLPDWSGPWLMNMFRGPDPKVPGVGTAMLSRALEVLGAIGEDHLGLAVTSTNPARRTYEKLGFTYDFEGWVLRLPRSDDRGPAR